MRSKKSIPSEARGHSWIGSLAAVVAGLLNSSCCVIQLVLNWFSFGCAGFAVLDPFRPLFLTASFGGFLLSILYGYFYQNKPLITKNTLITLFIISALSASPEIVRSINENGHFPVPLWWAKESPTTPAETEVIIHLTVEGMKCDGCARNVKNHLDAVSPDCTSIVLRETKRAKITCSTASIDPAKFVEAVNNIKPAGKFAAKLTDAVSESEATAQN